MCMTFERARNPLQAKLWHLLERNATTKQTTTLGLSFEMGTLMYELSSEHNKLADAVYALCTATSLTSREATREIPSREGESRSTGAAIILCLLFLGIVALVIFLALPTGDSDRELLCTVGDSAVTVSVYPPDKMCSYLYYTHVIIQGDNIYGAKVETSWKTFKYMSTTYRTVKAGVSFDYRYITAAKIRSATDTLAELSSVNIRHFGVLNVIMKPDDLLKKVFALKSVLQEIKNKFNNSHTVMAIGSRDYSVQGYRAFTNAVKFAVE
ncbi:hypothetical protein HPB49_021376 [Dermacentor silvarum]|uniref:Uncharacterized protein n=1 Tax=Dermacentor silvarum TaxID=543639 RepID=A0ACB8CHB9_DERSI|nr:hypothetical protein HPB49_021376 [Dermacentor silvarum]